MRIHLALPLRIALVALWLVALLLPIFVDLGLPTAWRWAIVLFVGALNILGSIVSQRERDREQRALAESDMC